MEPPHVMLGSSEEECHSNESGWTMYIGSPRDEDDAHCGDEENDRSMDYDYEGAQADPDAESDDSMASDASSGPSHYGTINPLGNGFTNFEPKEEVESDHKASKSKVEEERVVEKNETLFINSQGKAPHQVQNGSKVKVNKNHRVGNRK
ncbi:uncharacterized protein LOC109818238 [Cajanus cajan]|uniref:Uncharacterized protein n=1 Tax=Cajanus cajan TaxID=3821 RepID=A0A151RJI2_CAJCA|nr:uncharacterized protein LOC109818238 [Cajanus cajan]XP_020239259.1 uncharacterized protein LOC109818238 [Cajanus cajan]XP_020239260.1 uncharacterized protein LOC109818238 [Cajanus cajan]XP_020239262.1 uncharacterized protein LOC109818238 [Cajanus cajan]KYP42708.1 hypothetical protein KK1_035897 [Cajanus cajan]